jgi:hypothetical protein
VTCRVGQVICKAITKNKQDQVILTTHASKLKMNTRTKHIRTRTQSLYRKVKIKELTDLQDYFRSSSECSTRLLIGLCLRYYYKTKTFTSGELKVMCVILISTSRGVFIGVQGGITDLVKSVTRQVVPTDIATWPTGHGVQPPLTFSLGFPSTASWRVSP